MSVKAIILDLKGTLLRTPGVPEPGAVEMVLAFRKANLLVAVAANKTAAQVESWLADTDIRPDYILSKDIVGIRKPSPRFVHTLCQNFGIQPNQTVYLGDTDKTDAFCAANAKVLYLNAGWSNPDAEYGITLDTPADVVRFVHAFLLRDPVWFWRMGTPEDGCCVRSLIDGNGAGDQYIKDALIRLLKQERDSSLHNGGSFAKFVLYYLLANLYQDGLYQDVDWWTTYPGHKAGASPSLVIGEFLGMATRLFRDRYIPDLLVRHTTSPKSSYARHNNISVPFTNQANTVLLNPAYQDRLDNKSILVMDDFCTDGYAFECARHLLEAGGAAGVVGVSVGRYGTRYQKQSLRKGVTWDPFTASHFGEADFHESPISESSNAAALEAFLDAVRIYAGSPLGAPVPRSYR